MIKIIITDLAAIALFIVLSIGIYWFMPGFDIALGLKAAFYVFITISVAIIFSIVRDNKDNEILIIALSSAFSASFLLALSGQIFWIVIVVVLLIGITMLLIKKYLQDRATIGMPLVFLFALPMCLQIGIYDWLLNYIC